jgi:hypothetical protein
MTTCPHHLCRCYLPARGDLVGDLGLEFLRQLLQLVEDRHRNAGAEAVHGGVRKGVRRARDGEGGSEATIKDAMWSSIKAGAKGMAWVRSRGERT